MTRNCLNVMQKHANIDKKAQGRLSNYVVSPELDPGYWPAEVSRAAPRATLAASLGLAAGDVIKSTVTEPYMQVPGEGVHQTDSYGDSVRSSERMANAPSQAELDYAMNQVNARRKAKDLPNYNNSRYGGPSRPGVKPSGALGTWFNNSARAVKDTVAPNTRNIKMHVSAPTDMQVADYAHVNTLHRIDNDKLIPYNSYTRFNLEDPNLVREYTNRSLARLGNTTK